MESLISSIWNFDGLINSALIFVTFGLLGVFIWKRAGSAYSLLNRLWEFCLGGKTFHDGKINAYFNERNDVERFNVLFNVGARNKEEIKSLINWTKKKNIDIRHVTAAKGWFEISTLKAIKPLFIANVGVFVSCVLTMLLLSNFMLLALKPSALVRLGDDKSWVWINDHIAESSIWTNNYLPLNWTEWKLDKKQCESEDFDKTVFSEKAGISVRSVDRICENFSSGSLSDTLNNIIKNQKLAWVLAIYPFIFTIICFFSLLRRGAASKLSNEVHNSQN
ncbi:hypothetical protein C1459_06880 [Klebsiella pneumoniae]|nr:hypothetical protein C1459_06880 [Klebsiella pneumoniae]